MSFNLKKTRSGNKTMNTSLKSLDDIHSSMMKSFKKDKDKTKENEYFLSVGDILMEYYSLEDDDSNVLDLENLSSSVTLKGKRQELVERYYDTLGIDYSKKIEFKSIFCENCQIEMKRTNESYLVCTKCGVIDNEKIIDGLNFEERCEIKQIFIFDYKRINYFTEWLNQIQANEITEIPDELIEDLKLELFKRNIKDTSKLTNAKLKKILKETNYSKYYEHIPLIISKLCNNSKPLCIPENTIQELKNMFLLIQEPFEKFKGDRKNFLSYPYVLYKFCELLNLEDYLDNFSLLKSRDKLMKSDVIWKKMIGEIYRKTNDSKWRFIASC